MVSYTEFIGSMRAAIVCAAAWAMASGLALAADGYM